MTAIFAAPRRAVSAAPAAVTRAATALVLAMLLAGCAAAPARPPMPAAAPGASRDSAARLASRPGATTPVAPPRAARARPGPDVGTLAPALGAPQVVDGRVSWAPRASAEAESLRAKFERVLPSDDPDRVWGALALLDPRLEPIALRRAASLALREGDTTAADASLARLAAFSTPWGWEALRTRAELAVARGDAVGADSMLESADRSGWPELERAAWLLRRARLRAELGDMRRAAELCRQLIRRYPSMAPAAEGVGLLESLLRATEEPMTAGDREAAAEVQVFRGETDAAATWLRLAIAQVPESHARIGTRLAQILRRARRFDAASRAVREALAAHPPEADRARLELEDARIHRDAGRAEQAYARFADAAVTNDAAIAATAWWEAAREADQAGAWTRAREFYRRAESAGGEGAAEARLRRGLLWFAEGVTDSALASWEGDGSTAARFWRAIARRPANRSEADSLLGGIAALPGFGFYESAARETLGLTGWPGVVAVDSCPWGAAGEALLLARDLIVLSEIPGFPDAARARDDAGLVVSRWSAGAPTVSPESDARPPRAPYAMLSAARLAYALGRMPLAIRLARNAADNASAMSNAEAWAIAPWISPPAFDLLYASLPDAAGSRVPPRALVQALSWQESKFDPNARSRSNALGLMQLKLGAAQDAARWLKESPPTDARLQDPQTNVRYGVIYLTRLFERFEGRPAMALAAYNAGPGRIPPGWRSWIERGGDALAAELVPYPETRDYVKRILGLEKAYRELRPWSALAR